MNEPGDGIWDDGEWISWDSINRDLHEQDLRERFPKAKREMVQIFEELVDAASNYKEITGRYLPVFGELGELFAEITYGITRHKPRSQGSDGRLGNDFVEIKTISPEKKEERVAVKRKGNFNKLVVVKITAEFDFQARMTDRKNMGKVAGKLAHVAWSSMKSGRPANS